MPKPVYLTSAELWWELHFRETTCRVVWRWLWRRVCCRICEFWPAWDCLGRGRECQTRLALRWPAGSGSPTKENHLRTELKFLCCYSYRLFLSVVISCCCFVVYVSFCLLEFDNCPTTVSIQFKQNFHVVFSPLYFCAGIVCILSGLLLAPMFVVI